MTVWISGLDPFFLEAAASCALWNGNVNASKLEAYLETRLRCAEYPAYSRLTTRLALENPLGPRVVTEAAETSQALTRVHFVYMDVGCWAGTGEHEEWPRHREFGIVYGHLALLCGLGRRKLKDKQPEDYAYYSNPPHFQETSKELASSPLVDSTITLHPDWEKVRGVLAGLAGHLSDFKLRILGATYLTSFYIPPSARGEDVPVTVFLGDLHAPVATSSANAHIVENGREMLRGRLLVNNPMPEVGLGVDVAQQTTEALRRLEWEQTTTPEAIENWLRLYHLRGQRTADIFQDAGSDLRRFVDALQKIHEETVPVELVQLGDLFDLWLGFQRAFGDKLDNIPGADNLQPYALDFARFWVERTLFHTEQGPHLVHLLTLGQRADRNRQTGVPLRTTFLHGNHDNYLKHGDGAPIMFPPGHDHEGKVIHATHLRSFLDRPGLWAEHGHQPDTFNHDQNPKPGHHMTQLAFFKPGIRRFEGAAGWANAGGNGGAIQRATSIEHAITRCLRLHYKVGLPCRGFYVMGHTHEAMLKRVELLPCPPYQLR